MLAAGSRNDTTSNLSQDRARKVAILSASEARRTKSRASLFSSRDERCYVIQRRRLIRSRVPLRSAFASSASQASSAIVARDKTPLTVWSSDRFITSSGSTSSSTTGSVRFCIFNPFDSACRIPGTRSYQAFFLMNLANESGSSSELPNTASRAKHHVGVDLRHDGYSCPSPRKVPRRVN